MLYGKDQVMYAGTPVYKNERTKYYVPSLSTLVLLSLMNLLNILDEIKSLLIIPNSYNLFFKRDMQVRKQEVMFLREN